MGEDAEQEAAEQEAVEFEPEGSVSGQAGPTGSAEPAMDDYLKQMIELNASDLHLKAGGPAWLRVDGDLTPADSLPELTAKDTERFAAQLMNKRNREEFLADGQTDFSFSKLALGRFRVAVFRQRGLVGIVARRVLAGTRGFDALGLPPVVRKLAEQRRGLILVTGPTGSGKTTTTAAMLAHINATRPCHIVTVEDPIEVLHHDEKAIVDQREVGIDTDDFPSALRAVARQDPDVIFIGEMRDLETTSSALQAAETGHLVISTLHTIDAAETVTRIVDLFPPHQQHQTRASLAQSLRGVVAQRLLPSTKGGMVPAVECMVVTNRMREFVTDVDKTPRITEAIAEGSYYGMQTFDQHLLELVKNEEVELRQAMAASSTPHDFQLALKKAGLIG